GASLPTLFGRLEPVEMARFPHHRGQVVLDGGFGLALPNSGHDEDSRLRADLAQCNTFVDRGHAKPAGAAGREHPSTWLESMPVGVGLHDSQEFGVGSGEAAQNVEIVD